MKKFFLSGWLWAAAAGVAGAAELPAPNGEAAPFALTTEEQAFLAEHPELPIGIMNDWSPLNFVDRAGHPSGIGVDFLNEVDRLLGGVLRIHGGSLEENLEKTKSGELAGLMDVTPRPDRAEYLIFTQPYLETPHVIVGRRGARYYASAMSLSGRTVALERGFGNVKWFQDNFPAVRIRLYDTTGAALDAVARGQADAYAGNRAVALHLIEQEMLTNLQLEGRLEKPSVVLTIGVRKDWPVAASLLDRALGEVLRKEGRRIMAKWFDVASKAGSQLQLEPEEQTWLAATPQIRIGVTSDWPPMDFVDEAGQAHGIGVDFIGLLNERLGGRITLVARTFTHLMAEGKAGRLEALMDIAPLPGREEFFLFTKPYANIPHVIVGRKADRYFDSYAGLSNRTVAIEAKSFVATHIRQHHRGIRVVEYPTTRDALAAVSGGKADAYVGNRAGASWLIGRELLSNLQVQGTVRETSSVNSIGVRKDLPELASILEKALASLSQQSIQAIYERWGGAGEGRGAALAWIQLSPEEKQWLDAHPVIRFSSNPRWAPVEFIDPEGMPRGISRDYLERIGKALGVDFRYVPIPSWRTAQAKLRDGEVDVLTSLNKASARKQDFVFTPPYLSLQTAIFTRQATPYVGEVSELDNVKVGSVWGYAMKEFLLLQCPGITLQEEKDVPTALRLLESGKVDAFVGPLLITSHYLQQGGHSRIKVAGETSFVYQPAFACRKEWAILVDILDKVMEGIDEDEKSAIARKWMSVTYEEHIDYSKVYKIGAGALALLGVFLYWNRRMAAEIRRRKAVEASLRKSEASLRKSEESLVAANKELEAFSYSVSHDLRAPLRHISGFVQLLQGKAKDKLDETSARYLDIIAGASGKMGDLIDDLLLFSRTGRAQMHIEPVLLGALVEECRHDLETDTKGRSIEWKIGELPAVEADRALLRQVMANLIGNAVKYTGKREKSLIEISARREQDEIVVCVRDNGAGFDMKYAAKLFGVFQRLHTEAEFEGTGIGLANVQRIVLRHGGRTWAVGEVDQGAAFYFSLPVRSAPAGAVS